MFHAINEQIANLLVGTQEGIETNQNLGIKLKVWSEAIAWDR